MTEMKENDDKNHLSPLDNNVAAPKGGDSSPRVPSRPTSARSTTSSEFPFKVRFRLYTENSWKKQLKKEEDARIKEEKNDGKAEAHLVDGELKFDDDEEEARKERDPKLVEGNVLPDEYGDIFRSDYYGKPLEEIDKYIKDKTFVAIAPRFKKRTIFRFSATKGCFILAPWNPLRKFAVYLATHQYFDILVILTILTNCVFLAMPENPAAETAEYIFLAIYTVEMLIKSIARGFILAKFTYLRDPWNWLDFVVIVSAYFTILMQVAAAGASIANFQGLRTFRVLRALKTVSIIPGLKTIVNALLRAFKLLLEVIMLTSFCLMIFALFGLQVYMGILRQKCVLNFPDYTPTTSMSEEAYWNYWVKNDTNWETDEEGDYIICGNSSGSGTCGDNYTCRPDIGENPNFGYTSFDHFGWAMLSSFQLITLDFWEDCYNKIIRAGGPWHVIFFIIVVFFGSFYLINLMLAVVAMSYEEEAVSANEEALEKKTKEEAKDPLRELANATKAAAKWRPSKEKSDLSNKDKDEKQNDDKDDKDEADNKTKLNVNGQTLVNHGKGRNPMVKMPSKDSGYSVQSSHSGGSKERDEADNLSKADSGTGSLINHGLLGDLPALGPTDKFKNLVKQESTDNISSSAIHLEKANMTDDYTPPKKKETTVIIIKETPNGKEAEDKPEGALIDRNCECCSKTSLFVPWLRIQNLVNVFASDPLFDLFITVCIALNTVFMAIEHHDQAPALTTTLEVANYIFTAIFLLEAIVKLISLSKLYFYNGWNCFDLVIVIASLIDLALADVDGLSVFRTFRLLRVFKLAQSWPTMKLLLTIIMNTIGALANLTAVLAIVIYIFAVLGLQLFSKKYTDEVFGDEVVRWHFKDFYHSMLMIFRVLCGEWIEPLWDCMRAADELCIVVFLPTLVFGNFIVLNLFLALLLNAFATDSIDQHKGEDEDANKLLMAFSRLREICCCCLKSKRTASVGPNDKDEEGEIGMESSDKDKKALTSDSSTKAIKNGPAKAEVTNEKKGQTEKPQANGEVAAITDNKKDNMDEAFSTKRDQFSSFNEAMKANEKKENKDKKDDEKDQEENKKENDKKGKDEEKDQDDLKLGDDASTIQSEIVTVDDCLPKFMMKKMANFFERFDETKGGQRWFKVRLFVLKVVEHKVFEGIILFLIFVSSLTLAFEDVYLYQKPDLEYALEIMNIIFAALFTLEMVLKLIAFGVKKYFTSFWTILDFFIVTISLASLAAKAAGVDNLSAFRSLRTLRAFRPLRAISRWQGMKIVVNALMLAIPAIVNVLLVCLVFWLIFSIMGVQFFAGTFYKCVDGEGERLPTSDVANKDECAAKNYSWINPNINFDNVVAGYLALFQVATFEGWMEVMADAVDSVKVDEQPYFEASKYYYLYFVAFIIFGSFFTLNLIIGVIIDNFNVLKKKYEGSYLDMFLTTSQRNYMNTLKKLGNKKPQKTIKRPKGPHCWNTFQAVFYDVSLSSKFDLGIVVFIFLNMIVMAIEHYKQSDFVTDILEIANIVFTTIFTLEAIVKIIGLRLHYFRQPWNVFDFVVVVISLLTIILEDVLANLLISPTLLRVVRVFRIGRVLRLIKAAKGIRKLLFALIISLPALLNIGALLALIMYIFAIIAMSSFGNVKITGALDDTVNFKTFANSFILLLRLSTSAGWNDILEPLLITPPDCDDEYIMQGDQKVKSNNGDCGTTWLAYFFMCAYILIIFLIVINMYIAVILENFNQAHEQEEVGVTDDDFDEFYVVWEKYDPLATQFLKFDHLSNFVADLDPPLGIAKPNEIALVAFDLPIVEGDKIHCLDILIGLVKNVLGKVEETEEFKELKAQMEEKFQETFPTRVNTVRTSSTMQKKKEDVAAKTLQRAWKSYKTQKALRNITKMALDKSKDKDDAGGNKQKGHGILNLGRRLSSALSNFFGSSSRPGSATSRHSVKSATATPTPSKSKNTLQVPSVSTIYQPGSDLKDIEL